MPIERKSWRTVIAFPGGGSYEQLLLLDLPFMGFLVAKRKGGGVLRRAHISGYQKIVSGEAPPSPHMPPGVFTKVLYVGRKGVEIEALRLNTSIFSREDSDERDLDIYSEFSGPGLQTLKLLFQVVGDWSGLKVEIGIDMWYSWT